MSVDKRIPASDDKSIDGDSTKELDSSEQAIPKKSNPQRSLNWKKKLAFAIFLLFVLTGLFEVILIATGISYPLLYQPDEYCATRLKANMNVRYIEEGTSVVRTNSAGFRDEEWTKNKKREGLRIAVVGDSFCEAIQVPREKSFCYLLEEKLNTTGVKAEVLNFGISGYGTAQEYELLRHYVLEYKPDLVILAVFLGNDIGDNSRVINPGQMKPYYDLVDGELQLDASFRDSPEYQKANSRLTRIKSSLINSFRCLQVANKFYVRMRAGKRPRANVGIGLDPQLYKPPETPEWKDAWSVTESLIKAFHSQTKESGSKCLVLTLSNPIQVHPIEEARRQFKARHQIETLFYPDHRIRSFCDSNQIPCFQLSKTLYQEAANTDPPIYFHGFENTELGTGHWNELGHRRVSELLSKHLGDDLMGSTNAGQ